LRRNKTGVPSMLGHDAKPILSQIVLKHRAELHVVVDKEYFFHRVPHLKVTTILNGKAP
jgi:hypothetical protein